MSVYFSKQDHAKIADLDLENLGTQHENKHTAKPASFS